jgi:putative oxidoreductase
MSDALAGLGLHLGRAVLASLFVLGGINKILNFDATQARMTEVGLEPAALLLPATIALELGGGLMVALGTRFSWAAAFALALFTVATNVFFHRFWEAAPPMAEAELSMFFKNVAIAGGLLFYSAVAFQGRS